MSAENGNVEVESSKTPVKQDGGYTNPSYGTEEKDGRQMQKEEFHEPATASEAFSTILESVGSGGKYQWYLFFITAFCGNFTALHNMGAVFLAASPDHWCDIPGIDSFYNSTDGVVDIRNASIPWEIGLDNKGKFSSCQYYVRNYSDVMNDIINNPGAPIEAPPNGTEMATCSNWVYDSSMYLNTVVSEWDLVCDKRSYKSTVQSTYMVGFMLGALIISALADKFGRRTMLLLSTVLFAASTIGTHFSVNYTMFIFMRLCVAAFGSGIFLSNFVILMESVGIADRTLFGVLYHFFFSTGMILLAVTAYFLRDWRDLQLATSVPCLLMLIYFFIVPESPRWLMMNGRSDEALEILAKMARVNGGSLPPKQHLDIIIEKINRERSGEPKVSMKQKALEFVRNQATLVMTPNMRRRCLTIFFAWFTVSMIYYGLAFSGGNLGVSSYALVSIGGLVECVACFFNIWALNKLGRRITLCLLLVICGVALLVIVFIPKELTWMNLILSCVGRFFISPGFNVVFMYSAELVPTHVRNVAVGTSSMCARVGSGLAPYMVDMLGEIHYAVPSTVFGVVAITSGLLSLGLPETGNQRLPESIKEIESLPR